MAIVAPALLLLVGLVVDGGGQLTAVQQAEGVAAQAARAGVDAGAGADIAGRTDPTSARIAAETFLRDAGATGTVRVEGQQVTVTTAVTYRTSFLGLIGVHTLTGTGEATARLVPGG